MPKTGGSKMLQRASFHIRTKRLVALAFILAGLLVTLDQAGFRFGSLSALAQRPAARPTPAAQHVTISDCSFSQDEEKFRGAQTRHRRAISDATQAVAEKLAPTTAAALVQAQEMPQKNVIDNILFERMARDNVLSAPLASDAEYLRRVTLDLTGRIPSVEQVLAFLDDQNPHKRDALVDRLMQTPEFTEKWANFFGDLYKNTAFSSNINRYRQGRDVFHEYLKQSIASRKSYTQMAGEIIGSDGDSYVDGPVNFIVGGNVVMGPAQDTMDGLAVVTTNAFLGLSAMDCLLCHDGAGHLDAINLWGSKAKRAEAYGMSAFFARTRRVQTTISQNPFYAKYAISENPTGEYQLNTNSGNRQNRTPINGRATVDPKYMFGPGGATTTEHRRKALARYVVNDPQFARAVVNYIWEELMVEALVSPANSFDLARLNPNTTMPEGWTHQPANPELLDVLSEEFRQSGHDLRFLIGLIAKSNAYQLSSQYPGEWHIGMIPYYARKFARRLDAEEIHDAIIQVTTDFTYVAPNNAPHPLIPRYTIQRDDNTTRTDVFWNWASQFPEPVEPRTNGGIRAFLDSFMRGDRDQRLRTSDPSILQALNLMNNGFVMGRIHRANTGSVVWKLLLDANNTNQGIVDHLYVRALGRYPTEAEYAKIMPHFQSLGKQQATESLQWVLLNKVDFIFNY